MNRHLFAALVVVTASFAGLLAAPSAVAERECLTLDDTEYFVLKYAVGYETWAQAYAGLDALDCPGILAILCKYWDQLVGATTIPTVCLISKLDDALPVGPSFPDLVRVLPPTGRLIDEAWAQYLP